MSIPHDDVCNSTWRLTIRCTMHFKPQCIPTSWIIDRENCWYFIYDQIYIDLPCIGRNMDAVSCLINFVVFRYDTIILVFFWFTYKLLRPSYNGPNHSTITQIICLTNHMNPLTTKRRISMLCITAFTSRHSFIVNPHKVNHWLDDDMIPYDISIHDLNVRICLVVLRIQQYTCICGYIYLYIGLLNLRRLL